MKEFTAIMEETFVLINTIKNTSVYKEYQSSLEDLQRYPELKEITDAFRKENYLTYREIKSPVSFADVESLEEKRLELVKHPQIDRYLKAELALCRVLQDIQNSIVTAIEFD